MTKPSGSPVSDKVADLVAVHSVHLESKDDIGKPGWRSGAGASPKITSASSLARSLSIHNSKTEFAQYAAPLIKKSAGLEDGKISGI